MTAAAPGWISWADFGSAGAVRRHANVEGVVVNSIQTSFVSERMMDLSEAPVAFDRGARAKWRASPFQGESHERLSR
jgi:hypothetical protein